MRKMFKRNYSAYFFMASLLAGCAEPYSADPNANKDPVVESVFLFGHIPDADIGADFQHPKNPVPYENFNFSPDNPIFNPYQALSVRYNKLINGETVEKLDYTDPVTKQLQGDCNAPDGVFEIKEAGNGVEGLAAMEGWTPDLILSDWNMPEMSGIEFIRKLREMGNNVKFGFVTSEGTEEMRKMAHDAGALFLIAKPFTVDVFRQALANI